MEPQDVAARLGAVQGQLKAQRQAAKAALDAAWDQAPQACTALLHKLVEAHDKLVAFSEVSEKALPLLSTLETIERLRRDAVAHLDRLARQGNESRRMKTALGPGDLERIERIPETVGERFDLSLLSEDQLRMIEEARDALQRSTLPAAGAPAPAPPPAPGARSAPEPERASAPPPPPRAESAPPVPPRDPEPVPGPKVETGDALDAALEAWTAEVHGALDRAKEASPPGATEPPPSVGGDEALDAMFAEAVATRPPEPAPRSTPPARPEPVPAPPAGATSPAPVEPPAPAPAPPTPPASPPAPRAEAAGDPLEDLLSRAGFQSG